MKKKYFLSLFLIVNLLFSQKKQLRGFYIDNDDKKTEFTIKYWELTKTPQVFEIKELNSTSIKKITINDAKVVVLNDVAKYVRGNTYIDRHLKNLNSLDYNDQIIKNPEAHFFNCIVEGKYCLLSFEDKIKINIFVHLTKFINLIFDN